MDMTEKSDQGEAEAQHTLGIYYNEGQNVPQDFTEAAALFRLAADQGDVAQSWLGYFCESGMGGVKRDMAEAVRLYRAAAAQGDARALAQLGVLYERGRGVLQSDEEATACYAAASAVGAESLFAYGVQHLTEFGGRKAPEAFTIQIAVRDLTLAARLEHAGAVGKLTSISSRREVASACCMGCGATRKLLTCGKCGVAVFCDRACQASLWRTHKPSCRQWRDEGTEEEEGEEEE
mmetsp:Transcript_28681/g.72143  ORF Transcript_28681/g.72143 Transcript_28681/m.72143 type:complete len:235 (+) Transcript_28681:274-978(+)